MRSGGVKKNGGQLSQALGRSRGGFSTKVHVGVDGLGDPLRFRLTGGQEQDVTQAEELIDGLDSEYVKERCGSDNTCSLQAEGAPLIRRVSIQRASSGRMLHRQDRAFPPHLLPVRQAGEQIPRVPTFRRCSHMAKMKCQHNLVTLGLLSLSCPSVGELGRGEIAEGLGRPDGVVGALPGQDSQFRAAISREKGVPS